MNNKIRMSVLLMTSMVSLISSNVPLASDQIEPPSWTMQRVQEAVSLRDPHTIQLFIELTEQGMHNPKQLADILNLKSTLTGQNNFPIFQETPASSPASSQTKKNSWTHNELLEVLNNHSNASIIQLYTEVSEQIIDPTEIASMLGLTKPKNISKDISAFENSVKRPARVSFVEKLKNLNEESKKFDNADVHSFNRAFVVTHRETVLNIAQMHSLHKTSSFDTVIKELNERAYRSATFKQSLNTLRQHLHSVNIDNETGLNVIELFSMIWDACKKVQSLGRNEWKLENHRTVDAINYFAWSIEENIRTQGGCFPGYSGRFFRDLMTFLTILEKNNKL